MADGELPNHGTRWTQEEEQQLCELYPDNHTTELVQEFGRTIEAIKVRAKRLDLTKSEEYKQENQGLSDEVVQQGLDAEDRFESYADERGWTWYRNSEFNNYHSNKKEYEHKVKFKESLLNDPEEDWISPEKLQAEIEEAQERLDRITGKPGWFVGLRGHVDKAMDDWDNRWTRYPDYVVGEHLNGPLFVEVKYGSSNLSKLQHEFFSFLTDHGVTVYVFRVQPTDKVEFSEWDGSWK